MFGRVRINLAVSCQDDLLLLDPTEDQEGKKINNAPAKQSLATETLDLVRF